MRMLMYNDYVLYLKLFSIVIILTSASNGFELDEEFNVSGDGHLYSRTDTLNAEDLLSGYGDQYYHKNIFTKNDVSDFESNYRIICIDQKDKNISKMMPSSAINSSLVNLSTNSSTNYLQNTASVYSILFKTPSGLHQSAIVYSIRTDHQNFTSNNSIVFEPVETNEQKNADLTKKSYDLKTSIYINGTGGLFENVVNKNDVNTKMRPVIISESIASSSFVMKSKLEESVTFPGSEAAELSSEADKPLEQEKEPERSRSSANSRSKDESIESSETFDESVRYLTLSDLEYLLVHKEISKNEYLSDLNALLKAGRINENGYISHINKMRNQRLILLDNIEYDNLVKEAKISKMTYDQLVQGLENKKISASDYLNILGRLKESDRINDVDYLSGIYILKEQKIFNDDEYSAYKQDLLNQLMRKVINNDRNITASKFRSIILELRDKKLIGQDDYEDQSRRLIREMVYLKKDFIKSGDLSEIEYLEMAHDAINGKAITQIEYEQLKKEILEQLKEDYVENRRGKQLTWGIYKISLSDMLNRSIINITEYDEQLHGTTMANLKKWEELVYDDDSIPKDDSFVDQFLDLLDYTYYNQGYISPKEYSQFLISLNNTQISENSRNLVKAKLEEVVRSSG